MVGTFVAVIGAFALLHGAAAQKSWTTDEAIAGRVDSRLINNQCYPAGTWMLGSETLIPPCISEQIISRSCESATDGNMNSLRSCLLGKGSTYAKDLFGCLECKWVHRLYSSGEHKFWRQKWQTAIWGYRAANPLTSGIWDFVLKEIDWSKYPNDRKGSPEKPLYSIQEYYKNAPKTQNIGAWTTSGKMRPRDDVAATAPPNVDVNYFYNEKGGLVSISTTSQGTTA